MKTVISPITATATEEPPKNEEPQNSSTGARLPKEGMDRTAYWLLSLAIVGQPYWLSMWNFQWPVLKYE
jgi:hypothetical protein